MKDSGLNAGVAQLHLIAEIAEHIDQAKAKTDAMVEARRLANLESDSQKMAIAYHKTVKETFDDIRYHADKLEQLVDDKMWQLPKYRELLFLK